MLGSLQAALTIAQRFAESSASDKALIEALSTQDEIRAGQECVRGQVSLREAAQASEQLHRLAGETCQAAMTVLHQQGAAREADAYKRWIMDMGRRSPMLLKKAHFVALAASGSVLPKTWCSRTSRLHYTSPYRPPVSPSNAPPRVLSYP